MPIALLPPQVAARIAAGEVVERPASAVKELLENALDAGASTIVVDLRDGGRELLRVVDDGAGISHADTSQLFQRHATSKLTRADDLANIGTLGFRGEALYSLAAVAQVSLLTRSPHEAAGTYLEAGDGGLQRSEPHGAPQGTSVTVRHLFQKHPARQKFLGSAHSELIKVERLVTPYVLAYPHVRFTLISNGKRVLIAPGSGELREAVAAAYGAPTSRVLLAVGDHERLAQNGMKVIGLVSPPELHRSNRNYICLFVNRRPIQNRSLIFAVTEAYRGLLPIGRSPIVVLSIIIPVADVDVNVHPTKAEVRFQRESEVFAFLQQSVRESLITQAPVPTIDSTVFNPVLSPFGSASHLRATQGFSTGSMRSDSSPAFSIKTTAESRQTIAPKRQLLLGESVEQTANPLNFSRNLPALRVVGQLRETYIVAEGPDGMYLLDQHAAHECILYERLRDAVERGSPEIQGLLEPTLVELTHQQAGVLANHEDLLARYGWSLESFGERSCLVRAAPAVLNLRGPAQALTDLLDNLLTDEPFVSWEERMAATVACHGSVRAGMPMAMAEMIEMVRLLEKLRQPHTCPHGRPTMVHLSANDLDRGFRRR
jgi:DNA mismatch repair protein MutL